MSAAARRFVTEITSLIDKTVTVVTIDDKTFTGTLTGINTDTLSLCLSDVSDAEGQINPIVVLSGNSVSQISSAQKAFDLRGLAERLEKVFPRMIKLYEKEGFIWVMDRVKVTEDGVVEGSGPAAERVQRVHSQFLQEHKGE